MSKMPAKKKSCFQITSVTQAQVAASSITDDTESLDDPDESRTEDVSSEIFDVSRADMGVCDRSSSEETLNNVGEAHEGQPAAAAPVNGGFSIKSVVPAYVTPHVSGGSVPVPTATQPSVTSLAAQPLTVITSAPGALVYAYVAHAAPVGTGSTSTVSCSSRFRVIKLDHGTGEPFRRGRWTCTEFYERDSEGSSVSRTVDSIKHAVTLDHSIERDSGLGLTGGSVVLPSVMSFSAQPQESTADSGYSVAHHTHPPDPLQQGYGLAPQIGSGVSAFQPAGYSIASQQIQQVNMQPVPPQTLLPGSINGLPQRAMLQKSPIMPPVTQAQQFAYSTQPTSLSGGQPDYRQQHHAPLQPQGSSTQNLPMASLSLGPPPSQGPSPVITPAGPGAQAQGMVAQAGDSASAHSLLLQGGSGAAMASTLPGSGLQQPVSQSQPSITTSTSHGGVQNVPPATVPSTSNTPPGMASQASVQAQGAHGGAMTGLPSGFSNQAEDGRSDALPQPSTSALAGKDGVKQFIRESFNLPTPTVNSLFGIIPIPMDGDEDSASGASVVAIDNKIEQAMDLVKSHLMYAVREEVEVLKEQIKELYERNSLLERENAVLKSLANTDQLGQLSTQLSPAPGGGNSPPTSATPTTNAPPGQSAPHQPNAASP